MPDSLVVSGLSAGYDGGTILANINIALSAGDVVGIIGSNGVGKSTLVNAIMGTVPVQHGQILLEGRDLLDEKISARASLGLTVVPQGHRIFSGLTVHENLLVCRKSRKPRNIFPIEKVYSYFPELASRKQLLAGNLSGGQQAMLALCRGLIANPKFLLLDEPSEGLSPAVVARLGEIVKDLSAAGCGILLVEQNVRFCQTVSDHVFELVKGTLRLTTGSISASLLDE